MRIAVVGLGYVGLVQAACLADAGHRVSGVESDEARLRLLLGGETPFYEPGLSELVRRALDRGGLRITSEIDVAVCQSEVVFLTVGTPPRADGSSNLDALFEAGEALAAGASSALLVAVKSTVPVGTCDDLESAMRRRADARVDVVANPEFLAQGRAIADFREPRRVVLGSTSEAALEPLLALYRPFVESGSGRLVVIDRRSAELAKYAANGALALRVSMINEYARLCDAVGADIEEVRQVLASDPRIGPHFLEAGLGFGGSCLPKDITSLLHQARAADCEMPLVEALYAVNQGQRTRLAELAVEAFGDELSGRRFAVWGLAFKPGSDDLRESPAILTIDELLRRGARLTLYDPAALDNARALYGGRVDYASTALSALEGAEALLLCTAWPELAQLSLSAIAERISTPERNTPPYLFDGRNLFDPVEAGRAGLVYRGVGRGRAFPSG
ncbi:MAG: UDP-glucose/GDP-mannose dehydrogenase family protein [Myxococcales bacterium]|nr:UDP-glucose/GDP-mannose dehydrogenase family protein [Myxococcales bacterium]